MATNDNSAMIVAGREHVVFCFDILTSYFSDEAVGTPTFDEAHWRVNHNTFSPCKSLLSPGTPSGQADHVSILVPSCTNYVCVRLAPRTVLYTQLSTNRVRCVPFHAGPSRIASTVGLWADRDVCTAALSS